MKKTLCSLLLGFGLAGACCAETFLIDVRTPDEFNADHIPGALNIEYQNIVQGAAAANIKAGDDVYLYCRSGKRAGVAEQSLKAEGYTSVTNLGGIEDARAALGR